ncbi:hypothetical protein IKG31_04065 [Candidatus Saccharibacteria bacterium]|nr:hypothetical protein [Candidatus Saccharibacteria bacterium]
MPKKPFIRAILASLIALFITIFANFAPAHAEESVAISPMYQNMLLIPGKKTQGTFTVYNPGSSKETSELDITIQPFWQDENNDVDFTEKEDYSQMANWITIDKTSYTLKPNESKEVTFTVDVPEDAPAGGQYVAFVVQSHPKSGNSMITQVFQMAHLVYAEVAGQTTRGGEISGLQLSSFLFGGKITAGASVKNDGNIHAKTSHILRILPLFGDEELFTNEETPQENIIMPGASRYTGVTWDDTPSIGIFRANYIVEFEGVKKELSKVVIICPLWLLIVICLIIAIIIYRIVSGIISRKDKKE